MIIGDIWIRGTRKEMAGRHRLIRKTGSELNPVDFRVVTVSLDDLILGFHGEHVDFEWRPYDERKREHRADYDRLIVSVFHLGILSPLITYMRHVLIGMRRAEIGMRVGIKEVSCWEIVEDVSQWTRTDIARLNALKEKVEPVRY